MGTRGFGLLIVAGALLLGGCAGNPMRQYDSELRETVQLVQGGSVKKAIDLLEKNNEPGVLVKDKDLLYYLEKGELLALDSSYPASKDSWLKADEFIREWEDAIKSDPNKVLGDIGSYLINDKTRRYDGQDYEKVMLSTKLMLTHIMQGSYDLARIEMKKTVEREKLIESFREKEYDKLQEDAKQQEVGVTVKDMKGYPMAELDAPEVTGLKNGYQNALSHYLAGYFFEVTGEPSMAEPGYRNALQLAPNSRIAQAGLREIGRRKPGPKESDVLFIIESGFAPAWKSISLPIPIPTGKKGLIATPLSFPLIKSENRGFVPTAINAGKRQIPVETLTNLDVMARRQLKDQMPGIVLRTAIRAVLKSVAQEQANKAGAVAGLLTTAVSVVSEQADDRSWRMLPERISVARATLPVGTQSIEFQAESGVFRKDIDIGSRFTIIPIRLTGGTIYVGQPNTPGAIAIVEEAAPAAKTAAKRPASRRPAKKAE